MSHRYIAYLQRFLRMGLALIVTLTTLTPLSIQPALAASGDRTLYLYYTHTRETAKFTFRKGGRYDNKVLAQLNTFLRDWRRNEPTKMDPGLFDLIWETYTEARATGPIHVVSAYRAPKTNEMLRSRSKAVAKNSRHTMGMAMDFFIPGVSISKLRRIAMSKQVGGVGYYPTSGSPFVHLDTGNVRAWPRMTRAQLQKVFPNGKTLHIPADGKVLSQKGYQLAKAEWTKCHSVPCNSRRSSSRTLVAQDDSKPKRGLLDLFFNNEESEGSEEAPQITLASNSPTSRSVKSVPVSAPTPFNRPDAAPTQPEVLVASAPTPMARPTALLENTPSLAVAAIDASAPPAPRALLSRVSKPEQQPTETTLTAYAPASPPAPEAQRALDELIQRRLAEASNPAPITPTKSAEPDTKNFEIASDNVRTASLGSSAEIDRLSDFITSSWTAVSNSGVPATNSVPKPTSNPIAKLTARNTDLIAPDMEHIIEIFVDPRAISSARYAVLFENDVADLDPATELGSHSGAMGFHTGTGFELQTRQFTDQAPLRLASR